MTTVVTRYDFRKSIRKYMKLAETETVIIVRNKQADRETGCVLMGWKEYKLLLTRQGSPWGTAP